MVPAGAAAPGAELMKPATDQATPAGSPVAENGVVWPVAMAVFSGVSAIVIGFALPLTLMIWGELGALPVSVMVSVRCPGAKGTKVTVMVHVPLALTVPLHEFVVVKSPALLPPMTTEEMFRLALPEFVTVTTIGLLLVPWLVVGKLTEFGEIVRAGMGAVTGSASSHPARKRRERT